VCPALRYLDLHTGEFGLGGGSLVHRRKTWPWAGQISHYRCGQTHKEQILVYLRQDAPIEMAYAEPTHPLPPIKPQLSLQPLKPKPQPPKVTDETSFDARLCGGSDQSVAAPGDCGGCSTPTSRLVAWVQRITIYL
jgi:hypothetical protein